jgi:hypothetical protein
LLLPFPSLGLFLLPLLFNIEKQMEKVLGQGLLLTIPLPFYYCKSKATGKAQAKGKANAKAGGNVYLLNY